MTGLSGATSRAISRASCLALRRVGGTQADAGPADPLHPPSAAAIFIAYRGQDLAGLATTVTVSASLQLSCYRQLRDLYVIPELAQFSVQGGWRG
jgi:hypothetical protein